MGVDVTLFRIDGGGAREAPPEGGGVLMTAQVLPHHVHGGGEHRVFGIHGWFGDRGAFGAMAPYLDGERFSWAFVDCRGYGQARGAVGEYTMDEVARDVLATADALGWEEFSVMGHSMGGKAAQALLAHAPERVRKVAGVSPVPASGVPFDERSWGLFTAAVEDPGSRRAIIDLTTGNRLTGTWLDAMVRSSVAGSDVEAFRGYLASWAKEDFHERVVGARTPMLVVVGEHDPAIGVEAVRATFGQWYPAAEIHVMPNVGHYAPHEAPIALTSLVERFLAA
jgi:pimeloyl-ACP methyl ester carboxylesterase